MVTAVSNMEGGRDRYYAKKDKTFECDSFDMSALFQDYHPQFLPQT